MSSLRLRLALAVITVAVLLIGVLAAALYTQVSAMIRADFDRRLVEDGRVLADLIEVDDEDGLELEFQPLLDSFDRQRSAETWWRLWRDDGTVLTGAPDAEFLQAPPVTPEPALADGRHGMVRVRSAAWRFSPRSDPEDPPPDPAAVPMLGLTVTRDTHEVDERLDELARRFWVLGALACLFVGGVAAWQVARGFAPVRRLAAQLSSLGPGELGSTLDTAGLPAELLPFVTRIDLLLERLAGALEREREFSGHVAHELRTPLAVLRTGLDLARREQAAGSDAHAQLGELLDTVDEMGKLVDNLLLLARVERGADATALRAVELRPLVDGVWRNLEAGAKRRGLHFDNRVPEDHHVQADPGKLHIVLQNLLGNAASYTERGGSIAVEVGDGQVLSVWDSGPQLAAQELERVFDRMWRADLARTDAVQHAGLGLSLAQALCRHMKLELGVHNDPDGGLRFLVTAQGGQRDPT
jgi:signal transduction histidine kinase